MNGRTPPTLDLIVLCSHVDFTADGRPFSLHEPLNTVIVTPDDQGRLLAPEFMAYVQMTDEAANGTYEFAVEVRCEGIRIPHLRVDPMQVTFGSRYYPPYPLEHVFVIRDLVFPAPAVYDFHIVCGHASMSDRPAAARPARLRVIRAEPGKGLP
jgi:hypothetical protein